MMRLHNAPAELLEKIAAHVGVQVVILDPDWNYIGFEEIPVPEQERQAAEAATIDEWLNDKDISIEEFVKRHNLCEVCAGSGVIGAGEDPADCLACNGTGKAHDPRTPAQRNLDAHDTEVKETRRTDYPL